MTEEETMDSMTDWENCKGQCGYTRFCRRCMQERDRLLRKKKQVKNRDDDDGIPSLSGTPDLKLNGD